MQIFKTHKRVDIDKYYWKHKDNINALRETYQKSNKWENYTTINCWYDRDCEHCPMGWEDIGYEGECEDCGCLFDYEFNVPELWKCVPSVKKNNFEAKIQEKRIVLT